MIEKEKNIQLLTLLFLNCSGGKWHKGLHGKVLLRKPDATMTYGRLAQAWIYGLMRNDKQASYKLYALSIQPERNCSELE